MKSSNKMMRRGMPLSRALTVGVIALMLAGCTSSTPVSVDGLRQASGDSVLGAKGKTLEDQDKIDEHVARACGANVYTRKGCKRHTIASSERRRELSRTGVGV